MKRCANALQRIEFLEHTMKKKNTHFEPSHRYDKVVSGN